MKKLDFKKWKNLRLQKVDPSKLDERTLLLNVYITQALTLLLAAILLWTQGRYVWDLLPLPSGLAPWLWGAGFAAAVIAADGALSRFVPGEVTDDGGINDMLFRGLPLWHIAVLSFVVAVCEELLFRGAVQHWLGPYWTSILFAAVHVRYLKHWLMTGIVFSISYGLGYIAIRTGTLWTPIFAHFIIDFVMGAIIRYRRNEES
ncbi:CPBP family intramembrane glutamic endopeptidase [Paenibacillus sp.]|uniref:CPBP family intramembrane glutamic endopeptidase n=1 Tax=Paenibacillus sp. TaxID=58172 RepID=UPI002D6497AF|nr:CPBP family intramembrane glutamic endopeptidase [Paenibacillus sp.]HZG55448.1 CPBP family intramembrane glutamic endopeptidase [Paenibacillus sp.]